MQCHPANPDLLALFPVLVRRTQHYGYHFIVLGAAVLPTWSATQLPRGPCSSRVRSVEHNAAHHNREPHIAVIAPDKGPLYSTAPLFHNSTFQWNWKGYSLSGWVAVSNVSTLASDSTRRLAISHVASLVRQCWVKRSRRRPMIWTALRLSSHTYGHRVGRRTKVNLKFSERRVASEFSLVSDSD